MSNESFLEFLKSRLNYYRKDSDKEQISAPCTFHEFLLPVENSLEKVNGEHV